MKFKNKKTGEIVEPKDYAKEFAYIHNSEWEKVIETKTKKENKSE